MTSIVLFQFVLLNPLCLFFCILYFCKRSEQPPSWDELDSMPVALGISLSVLGHLLQNVGTNIIKVSYRIRSNGLIDDKAQPKGDGEDSESGSARRMDESVNPLAMDISSAVDWDVEKKVIRIWYGGFTFFKLGAVLTFVALAFGPQFVSNVVCGHFMHGEKITNLVITGTVVIITGITLIVVSGSKTSEDYSMSEAVKLFEEDIYVIYICIAIAIAALSIYVYLKTSKKLESAMNFSDTLDDKTNTSLTNIELKEKGEGDSKQYFYAIYANPLTQGLDDRAYEASIPGHLMNESKDESPVPTIIASTDLRVEDELSDMTVAVESVSSGEEGDKVDDVSCSSSPTAKDPLNTQRERSEVRVIFPQNGVENCETSGESRRHRELGDSDQATSTNAFRITAFALYSAIIGTQVVSFAKLVSLAVFSTLDGSNQLSSPFTYLFLVLMIVFGVFWDYQLNKGVRIFDAAIIIPMLQCFWTLFSITNGGVLFQEFSSFSSNQVGLFITGVVLMLGGVCFLLMRPPTPLSDEEVEQGAPSRVQRTSIISEVLHLDNNEETSYSNSLVAMSAMSGMLFHKGILSGESDPSPEPNSLNSNVEHSWPGIRSPKCVPSGGLSLRTGGRASLKHERGQSILYNSVEVSSLFDAPVRRTRQESLQDIRVQRALQQIKRKFQRHSQQGARRKERPVSENQSRSEKIKNSGRKRAAELEGRDQQVVRTV